MYVLIKWKKKIQDRLQLTRNNWIKFLACEIWTRRVRTRTSQFIGSVRTKNTMFSTIVWDETRTSIVERVKSTELVPFQTILWWYSHTHTHKLTTKTKHNSSSTSKTRNYRFRLVSNQLLLLNLYCYIVHALLWLNVRSQYTVWRWVCVCFSSLVCNQVSLFSKNVGCCRFFFTWDCKKSEMNCLWHGIEFFFTTLLNGLFVYVHHTQSHLIIQCMRTRNKNCTQKMYTNTIVGWRWTVFLILVLICSCFVSKFTHTHKNQTQIIQSFECFSIDRFTSCWLDLSLLNNEYNAAHDLKTSPNNSFSISFMANTIFMAFVHSRLSCLL